MTSSKQPFHDRVVSSLKRARTIWSRTADVSKESAHATKVLDTILAKVSPPEKASTQQTTDDRRYTEDAAAQPSSSGNTYSNRASEQADTPASSWSAVNNKAPLASRAVRKDFSVAWDFGMDAFHSERSTKNRDSDDPIDMAVNGDMDWV